MRNLYRLLFVRGALVLDGAEDFYERLVWLFLLAVSLVLIGWMANLAGAREVSIVLSLILTAVTGILSFRPVHLALVAAIGAVVGALDRHPDATMYQMAKKFLVIYPDLIGKVVLWGSIILFALGTIPFAEDPFAFFGISAGLILLALISWQWNLTNGPWKKGVYWYVVIAIVVQLFMLLAAPVLESGVTWAKYKLNWDPAIAVTQVEQKRYEVREAQEAARAAAEVKALDEVLAKVRKGEPLTPQDEAILKPKQDSAPASATESKSSAWEPAAAGWKEQNLLWLILGISVVIAGIIAYLLLPKARGALGAIFVIALALIIAFFLVYAVMQLAATRPAEPSMSDKLCPNATSTGTSECVWEKDRASIVATTELGQYLLCTSARKGAYRAERISENAYKIWSLTGNPLPASYWLCPEPIN